MSSKVAVVTPVVPPGKVVPVKRIISPTLILCAAEVVRVTVVVALKVNVAPLIAVASGVTSKNCPSKYIIKNLSVYFVVVFSLQKNIEKKHKKVNNKKVVNIAFFRPLIA